MCLKEVWRYLFMSCKANWVTQKVSFNPFRASISNRHGKKNAEFMKGLIMFAVVYSQNFQIVNFFGINVHFVPKVIQVVLFLEVF